MWAWPVTATEPLGGKRFCRACRSSVSRLVAASTLARCSRVKRRGRGLDGRELPDALLARRRRRSRDIVLRRARPVQPAHGAFGGFQNGRLRVAAFKFADEFGRQQHQALEFFDGEVDAEQFGAVKMRVAHRLAEGQTGRRLDGETKSALRQREFFVVGVEAKNLLQAAGVGEGQQAFAADVQRQSCLFQRPARRRFAGRGELHGAVLAGPRAADGDWRPAERPAGDGRLFLHAPGRQLGDAHAKALTALLNRNGHVSSGRFLMFRPVR